MKAWWWKLDSTTIIKLKQEMCRHIFNKCNFDYDGQIHETDLFNSGVDNINPGISVSRVGSAAQIKQ